MSELLAATLEPIESGPFSYSDHKGDGTNIAFLFTFYGPSPGYIRDSDVRPFIRDSDENSDTYQEYTAIDYDDNNWNITGTTISFTSPIEAPLDGENNLRVRRIMPKEYPFFKTDVDSVFRKSIINNSFLQQLYAQHEVLDGFTENAKQQAIVDMNNFQIVNLGRGDDPGDAVNKEQLDEIVPDIEEATRLAYLWSQENEDTPVDDGVRQGFSAFHWAEKSAEQTGLASNEKDLAIVAKEGAEQAETNAMSHESGSLAYRNDSRDWATEAEDVPVDDGTNPVGFSAFHWAKKVSDSLLTLVKQVAGANGNAAEGAAVIPTGGSAQEPVGGTDALLRFDTDLGSFRGFNPVTGEYGEVGGGGVAPIAEYFTTDFTVTAKKVAGILHTVNSNIIATIDSDSWATDDWGGFIDTQGAWDDATYIALTLTGASFWSQLDSQGNQTKTLILNKRNASVKVIKLANGDFHVESATFGQDADWVVDKITNGYGEWVSPDYIGSWNDRLSTEFGVRWRMMDNNTIHVYGIARHPGLAASTTDDLFQFPVEISARLPFEIQYGGCTSNYAGFTAVDGSSNIFRVTNSSPNTETFFMINSIVTLN